RVGARYPWRSCSAGTNFTRFCTSATSSGRLNGAGARRPRDGREGLFDHLVGAGEKRLRYREAKRLGGLEVDDQLELGRLLNRQIGRFRPFENPGHVFRAAPTVVQVVYAVGNQTTGFNVL